MLPGSRTWRTALGAVALAAAVPAGCHSVPVAKLAPAANRPQSTIAEVGRTALLPATVALETPPEMGSMEPVRSAGSVEPAPRIAGEPRPAAPAPPPAPTPLLDAALQRAKGIEDAIVEEMVTSAQPAADPPKPEPAAIPTPTPAPAAVETPAPAAPTPQPEPPAAAPAPAPAPAPLSPEEQWRDGIQRLTGLAQARKADASDPRVPWDLRGRVLAWLAEPDIVPDVDPPGARDLRAVLRAVGETTPGGPAQAESVRTAIQVLENRIPLEIADLQLCTKVRGYGDFDAISPPVRRVGQQVVIYAKIDGIRHETASNGFRSRMAGQVEVIPEGGSTPVWTEPLNTAEDLCRHRRVDFFIAYLFTVPRALPAGRYTVRLTEHDLVADQTASRDLPLMVVRD